MPSDIQTPEQLQAAIYEVERYADWLRESSVRRGVGATNLPGEPTMATETLAVVKTWQKGKKVTGESLGKLAVWLRAYHPPVVHLVLADIAPPALRKRLSDWVRLNCHPAALLALSADSTIGGGVVIRTVNRLYDESFRHRLVANREALAKAVSNVR
jgi:hypothetical protein